MLKYNPVSRVRDILQKESIRLPEPPAPSSRKESLPWMLSKAYLGEKQQYGRTTESGRLNRRQALSLSALGIQATAGAHYHRGLVTARTMTGTVDILEIHNHFLKQLKIIEDFPNGDISNDVQQLLKGLRLCASAEVIAASKSNHLMVRLWKEHNIQLSQLGMLLLPIRFMRKLKEPVQFAEITAQRIGLLTELIIR